MGRAGRVVPVSPKPRVNERRCQVRLANILSVRVHAAEGPCGVDERAYGKTVWSRPSSLRSSFRGGVGRPTGSTTSPIRGAREARRNSAPGRARHKPSAHRAGKAVCSASPVCRCAFLIALHAHSGPWVPGQHPAFPAPSVLEGARLKQSSGEMRREDVKACLRSRCELENDAVASCSVIASAAKRSRLSLRKDSGLLRCARNDGARVHAKRSGPWAKRSVPTTSIWWARRSAPSPALRH